MAWVEGSIGEYMEYLVPGCTQQGCPAWPPDAFALCASILKRTGLYTKLVELLPDGGTPPVDPTEWPKIARELGASWRASVNAVSIRGGELTPLPAVPEALERDWTTILSHGDLPIYGVRRRGQPNAVADLSGALLRITLVADEACAGIGIRLKKDRDSVVNFGDVRLMESGGRTLTWKVLLEKSRVLPKQHTPQRGMTLRSLSHHLALIAADEVEAVWAPASVLQKDERSRLDVFNVLVLPWPRDLAARDFGPPKAGVRVPALPPRFRYFSVDRKSSDAKEFQGYLEDRLKSAREQAGDVDAIVLPELALTGAELQRAQTIAHRERLILIAGASLGPKDRTEYLGSANVAVIDPTGILAGTLATDTFTRFQRKHHRWCLDRDQIVHYGLGGVLPASHDCWELTDIGARDVNFFTLDSWLTFCVLVCEDLARQDPLADAIRAVGPNLVVALLMDGPQLSGRWASRYASVLAEDPGCSVLTITSLGMARLSRPREAGRPSRSRVVALWRDVQYGERELSLDEGHDAGVLSLVCRQFEEFTADGRGDGSTAFFPVFAGWQSLG